MPRTEDSPTSQESLPPCTTEMMCYRCGDPGYEMGRCKILADLISRGLLTRDNGGQIMYLVGSFIQ